MELFNLADKPEFIELVVNWLYEEWGKKGEKNNKNYWKSWVNSSLSKIDVPQTYIAVVNNELVATFSLWRCDLQSRQDIFPWFGGLVINPNHRANGYGKLMQIEALRILNRLGYNEVHLFTEISGYYEQTGWVFVQEIPDETGKMVRLYRRTTEPDNQFLEG